ncbi:MAG: HD domain-containing phosphohydrolase [Anaerovoracaceae bacterium]
MLRVEINRLLSSLSLALDYVEREIVNTKPYHAQRVAVITNRMAAQLGFKDEKLFAVTQAAILHDMALAEYLADEFFDTGYDVKELNMASHCIKGEEMLKKLYFYNDVEGAVLYHHECADGSGALGKREEETPVVGQIIHMADALDVRFSLYSMDYEKYRKMTEWVEKQKGILFSESCVSAFLESVDYECLCAITGEECKKELENIIPDVYAELSIDAVKEIAFIVAEITDYKSHFTCKHSLGIADKAYRVGVYYGYDEEMCSKLYVAGALHDIGKLLVSNDILEKPGRLTPDEYKEIQNHAIGTYKLLCDIKGLEDITRWASLHHEKLDGSGYPFGLKADELGKNERLMACLDIYQALVEDRPYKEEMSHAEAIKILKKMAERGQLDCEIVEDLNKCFMTEETKKEAEEDNQKKMASIPKKGGWRCPVCGYICEGDLPEDFICPQCEQPATVFEKI